MIDDGRLPLSTRQGRPHTGKGSSKLPSTGGMLDPKTKQCLWITPIRRRQLIRQPRHVCSINYISLVGQAEPVGNRVVVSPYREADHLLTGRLSQSSLKIFEVVRSGPRPICLVCVQRPEKRKKNTCSSQVVHSL